LSGAFLLNRRQAVTGGIAAMMARPAFAQGDGLPQWQPERLPPPSGRYVDPDGSIRIVGTAIMRNLVDGLNARFAAANPGFRFRLDLKPGLMAVGAITHGTTPFAPMPREFSDMESVPYRRIVGAEPVALRVAHGSVVARDRTAVLAIYVNRANPIAGLTLDQAARIFTTGHPAGDLTCWGQLGLTGEWADRPIRPAGTPEDTGFGSFMVREKMGGYPLSSRMTIRPITKDVIDLVESDPGAIGYGAVNFDTSRTRALPIAQRAGQPYALPTDAIVMSGRYPYDRFVYFYLRSMPGVPLEPWVRSYMELALSEEGQAVVAADTDSFLPLNAAELRSERLKLANV
jgi:phosphate transport system substrate-binding protein